MHGSMIALTVALLSGAVAAQTPPLPLRPEQATWFSPPAVPGK